MEKFRDTLKVKKEKAILFGAILPGDSDDGLAELTALAKSAGVVVVDKFQQKIRKPHPAHYIGKGKAEQLADRVKRFEADVVIFDNDLKPSQIRELERIIEVKVLDRSELILDIFATRAQTKQAKLQVDLAQLEYTYPRLTRLWGHLDTVTGAAGGPAAGAVGGIGTRGTGEKQLEIDRRLVKNRITELNRQLKDIDHRRIREIRARGEIFKICLVGYTNAGKSTLLNKLTDSDVFVEDKLFATLDTRTRKWSPSRGTEVLLSDTVGFVRNIPHHLVASFKATLEEAVNANLLLHVIDVSNPQAIQQIESVEKVLKEIGAGDRPVISVLNKADMVKKMDQLELLQTVLNGSVVTSARTGTGLAKLCEVVAQRCKGKVLRVRVQFSQSNGKIQSFLRANGTIIKERYTDGSVLIEAEIGENHLADLKRLCADTIEIIN